MVSSQIRVQDWADNHDVPPLPFGADHLQDTHVYCCLLDSGGDIIGACVVTNTCYHWEDMGIKTEAVCGFNKQVCVVPDKYNTPSSRSIEPKCFGRETLVN